MLITDTYRELNRQLLATDPAYATSGHLHREEVRRQSGWGRVPILDYGSGRKLLEFSLGPAYRVTNYDPCVEGCETEPEPHPFVYCGDVLEHVETQCLDDVLADLRRVTAGRALLRICIIPSSKTLADGRNAHLIVESAAWWWARIEAAGFRIITEKPPEEVKEMAWFIVERSA